MNVIPTLPQQKPGLAKTSITNAHARTINALAQPVQTGDGDGAGFLRWTTLVRVDSTGATGGFYEANAMQDEVVIDTSATSVDWSDFFIEGEKVVLMNQPEVGRTSHFITADGSVYVFAVLIGLTKEDSPRPIYMANYQHAVRNVRITAAGVWQETFEDKEDPSTATYVTITDSVNCTTG